MTFRRWYAAALAVALAAVLPARADEAELSKIRDEIRQLKDTYERRIQALEKRLQETESRAARTDHPATQDTAHASSQLAPETSLNPAISAILSGTLGNLSRDPDRYRINGFVPTGGDVAPPRRGLGLGESELALRANVDHLFHGALIASIAPGGGIEVEEGYVQTLGLARGFTLKAGRFFSGLGYLNEIHAHAWDFTDAPLASKVFLGGRLAEDGLQLKWVAPTELYADLGIEAGRGRKFPGGPDGGRAKNGFGSGNLFAHLGGDIGASTAWQLGVSYLRTSPQDRSFDDTDATGTAVTNSFTGRSRLWALSGLLKWAPNGNPTDASFKLQGEFFRRTETGTLAYDTQAASLGTLQDAYRSRQSGWYLQGVYQFMPMWRVGYRYDRLDAGRTRIGLVDSGALSGADFPILGAYNPKRSTVMFDWSPSEFSHWRLQLARDHSRMGEPDNQVFLQYIMSMGAHGAHKF